MSGGREHRRGNSHSLLALQWAFLWARLKMWRGREYKNHFEWLGKADDLERVVCW